MLETFSSVADFKHQIEHEFCIQNLSEVAIFSLKQVTANFRKA